MYLDPLMPAILLSVFGVLLLGFIAKLVKQPTVIAYLIAGVVLGPFGLRVIEEGTTLGRIGALGVVLLLFFVGMEVSIDRLLGQWRVAVLGTLAQILLSVAFTWALGAALDWSLERSIVLGFVISLSSTAVILPLLQQFGETHTRAGNATIGVVVAQDLAVVPMLLLIGAMGDQGPNPHYSRSQSRARRPLRGCLRRSF